MLTPVNRDVQHRNTLCRVDVTVVRSAAKQGVFARHRPTIPGSRPTEMPAPRTGYDRASRSSASMSRSRHSQIVRRRTASWTVLIAGENVGGPF
jgi:hypothetical protein